METALSVIGLILMFLFMFVSLFLVVIGLPGNWIILALAIVFGLVTGLDAGVGWWDLVALLGLAGLGEILEFVLTAKGAKKHGGSNKAMAAAIAGGLVGALLLNGILPIIGAVIGAFLGVYLGAFIVTYVVEGDMERARQIGAGAFMGRIGAVLVKVSMGVAMISLVVWQIFFT